MTLALEKRTISETIDALDLAVDRLSPRVANAFARALANLRARLGPNVVARVLEESGPNGLMAILNRQNTDEAFADLGAAISAAVDRGHRVAAESQDPVRGANGERVRFIYRPTNLHVARFAENFAATRVRELGEDVRQVVAQVVADGRLRGDRTRDVARRVRDSIGLTRRQEQTVENYRRMLINRPADALRYELRDRRFDPSLERARRDSQPLSPEKIDRMVQRYRERFVGWRALVIGRTEATRAVNGAQQALFQSYVDSGKISEDQIERRWRHVSDGRTRDPHRFIPEMNAGGVGLNQPFNSTLGPIMYPGDPNADPRNVVNCRCRVTYRVRSSR